MLKNRFLLISLLMTVALLAGCASGPDIRVLGMPESESLSETQLLDLTAEVAEMAFDRLSRRNRCDEAEVEEAVRRAVRREINQIWGKKPVVDVMVLTA